MKSRVYIFIFFTLFSFSNLYAEFLGTSKTKIVCIESPSEFGGGDVSFICQEKPEEGLGFWLRPSDDGFKNNLAVLLLAYSMDLPVIIYYEPNVVWDGAKLNNYYHLYSIVLDKR